MQEDKIEIWPPMATKAFLIPKEPKKTIIGSEYEIYHFYTIDMHPSPLSGALHDPRPFCQFKSRLIYGYHVKEHENKSYVM